MRHPNCSHNVRFIVTLVTVAMMPLIPNEASSTDQFSRQYNTSCTTCHTAFPKLNDIGLAFKDAGFQFSEEDASFIATPQTLLSLPVAGVRANKVPFRSPTYATPLSWITDAEMRALQEKYSKELDSAGAQISALPFSHRFCLSPVLNEDERMKKHLDRRSLRFAKFKGDTVLEVTGNYYAAYPREMAPEQRVRRTLQDLLIPMLKVLLAEFQNQPYVEGYVLEVSHHVRGKVLVAAQTSSERQALLGEVQIFLNSKAITLRPADK
jgi:hypothetical protein